MILEQTAVHSVRPALGNGGDVAHSAELRRVVHFADTDLRDRAERREQLRRCRIVPDVHRADAVDAYRQHAWLRTGNGKTTAVVDLHADLSGECRDRTRRTRCP